MATGNPSELKSLLIPLLLAAGAVMAFTNMGFWGLLLIGGVYFLGRLSKSGGNGRQGAESAGQDAAENFGKLSKDAIRDIMTEMEGGRKIEAIKIARLAGNLGLKEAKELVEFMEDQDGAGEQVQGSSVHRTKPIPGR